MTREEAITILKAFMENPLFSEVHKAAFNIAIHDIKQRHDWDINNLILINKENLEPQEPVLDKILISIGEEVRDKDIDKDMKDSLNVAISIMHKYQKIRCLINQAEYAGENSYTGEGEWILADKTYQKIQEILKDGNVD